MLFVDVVLLWVGTAQFYSIYFRHKIYLDTNWPVSLTSGGG